MERAKTRKADGSINPDYSREYYIRNKEKIAAQFRERYKRVRATPELLQEHRQRSTEATRRWRLRHPETVKTSRYAVYQKRKRRALEMIGGAVCVNCGCDELDYLEVNHINGGGAKEWREKRGGAVDRVLGGRDKSDLNVLCRVCNAMDYLKRKSPKNIGRFTVLWQGLL